MTDSNELDEPELQRIERLSAAATPGPWRAFVEGRDHQSGSSFIRTALQDIELTGASEADYDFVASARQNIGALIAEVRRLRAELARSRR